MSKNDFVALLVGLMFYLLMQFMWPPITLVENILQFCFSVLFIMLVEIAHGLNEIANILRERKVK